MRPEGFGLNVSGDLQGMEEEVNAKKCVLIVHNLPLALILPRCQVIIHHGLPGSCFCCPSAPPSLSLPIRILTRTRTFIQGVADEFSSCVRLTSVLLLLLMPCLMPCSFPAHFSCTTLTLGTACLAPPFYLGRDVPRSTCSRLSFSGGARIW
jgi:hypothetical protein